MKQPKLPEDTGALADFLTFAVPLRSAELIAGHAAGAIDEAWLIGTARRAGAALGTYGDALQFSDGKPRTGRKRDTVARTTSDLVDGVAAAALLAGDDGLDILGAHFCPRRCCTNAAQHKADDTADEHRHPLPPGDHDLADAA